MGSSSSRLKRDKAGGKKDKAGKLTKLLEETTLQDICG